MRTLYGNIQMYLLLTRSGVLLVGNYLGKQLLPGRQVILFGVVRISCGMGSSTLCGARFFAVIGFPVGRVILH
jgi:hypothetical protein